MLARSADPAHSRMLLPALVIGAAYAGFSAYPQYQEIGRVAAEIQERSAAVDVLDERVQVLPELKKSIVAGIAVPAASGGEAQPLSQLASAGQRERSYVHAFADVLTKFRSEDVVCKAATAGSDPLAPTGIAQRIALEGDFGSVLAALDAINAELPHAAAAELSMRRAEPQQPCHWDIGFQFIEEAE